MTRPGLARGTISGWEESMCARSQPPTLAWMQAGLCPRVSSSVAQSPNVRLTASSLVWINPPAVSTRNADEEKGPDCPLRAQSLH